jgi:hypothetical protein
MLEQMPVFKHEWHEIMSSHYGICQGLFPDCRFVLSTVSGCHTTDEARKIWGGRGLMRCHFEVKRRSWISVHNMNTRMANLSIALP